MRLVNLGGAVHRTRPECLILARVSYVIFSGRRVVSAGTPQSTVALIGGSSMSRVFTEFVDVYV